MFIRRLVSKNKGRKTMYIYVSSPAYQKMSKHTKSLENMAKFKNFETTIINLNDIHDNIKSRLMWEMVAAIKSTNFQCAIQNYILEWYLCSYMNASPRQGNR
jgi:multimeric flavodoxin WrbA